MKYVLTMLCTTMALANSLEAMQAEQQYVLNTPEGVQARADQDGLKLSWKDSIRIAEHAAYKPVITELTITDPYTLVEIVGANFNRVIPIEDAEEIVFHTWLSGMTNALDILQRAHERGISISYDTAQRLARREQFIDKFFSKILPREIKAYFKELFGKVLSEEQAQEIAVDLFERRISE